MRLRFVASTRANLFMTELLEVLAGEARAAGLDAEVVDGFPPWERDLVYVAIPHEVFAAPTDAQVTQTIGLCVEQPGTPWFDIAYGHARRMGALVDISPVGLLGLRAYGLAAKRLRLGYSPALDAWGRDLERKRDVDLLYMGSASRRREVLLSSYWETLWPRERVRLMVPPHTPKTAERPDFVVGTGKRELLARTRVLLSVRRQEQPYFEWVRAVEAIVNGAVLVCEHGAGHEPLVPGEHFLSGAPENLALLAEGLLQDPEREQRIRLAAYDVLRDELPLRRAVEELAAIARDLEGAGARQRELPPPPAAPAPPPPDAATVDSTDADSKQVALDAIAARRARARAEVEAAGDDPDELVEVHRTPAYDRATPRVTICIPCYRDADVVGDAVRSAIAQDEAAIEVLVVDDGSDDADADAAAVVLREHPHVPGLVLRRRVNAGLPAARNAMAQRARAALVLMLDADNELLPPAAGRLADALDADPGATFAYPILAAHRDGQPDGLLSSLPWEPALLRSYNFIDALALLRRDALLALDGYTTEERLHGWEDYDLWCRVAEHGGRGVHVPQMLARYRRTAAGSMLSVTDLDTKDMRSVLRSRYPATMG